MATYIFRIRVTSYKNLEFCIQSLPSLSADHVENLFFNLWRVITERLYSGDEISTRCMSALFTASPSIPWEILAAPSTCTETACETLFKKCKLLIQARNHDNRDTDDLLKLLADLGTSIP